MAVAFGMQIIMGDPGLVLELDSSLPLRSGILRTPEGLWARPRKCGDQKVTVGELLLLFMLL
jgi:hypothetical protein